MDTPLSTNYSTQVSVAGSYVYGLAASLPPAKLLWHSTFCVKPCHGAHVPGGRRVVERNLSSVVQSLIVIEEIRFHPSKHIHSAGFSGAVHRRAVLAVLGVQRGFSGLDTQAPPLGLQRRSARRHRPLLLPGANRVSGSGRRFRLSHPRSNPERLNQPRFLQLIFFVAITDPPPPSQPRTSIYITSICVRSKKRGL
jgi:hypothetical protein